MNKLSPKPSLGIKPAFICDFYTDRILELAKAIERRMMQNDDIEIPTEWVEEYNLLCKILNLSRGTK